MHISLIGMSNIGKTHWSQKLAGQGYERVDCDTIIEQKLAGELVAQGFKGIHDVARWMGHPYEERYAKTSRQYRDAERAAMEEVIARLEAKPEKPLIIDTTGSVIYAGDDVMQKLKVLTRVIYLEASDAHAAKLYEYYRAHPKPTIWGDFYRDGVKAGEEPLAAMQRLYPQLLAWRAARYQSIAHVTVPYEKHKAEGAAWNKLIGAAG